MASKYTFPFSWVENPTATVRGSRRPLHREVYDKLSRQPKVAACDSEVKRDGEGCEVEEEQAKFTEVKPLEQIIAEWKEESKANAGQRKEGVVLEEMQRDFDFALKKQMEESKARLNAALEQADVQSKEESLEQEKEYLLSLLSVHRQEREISILERSSLLSACRGAVHDAVEATKLSAVAEGRGWRRVAGLNSVRKKRGHETLTHDKSCRSNARPQN